VQLLEKLTSLRLGNLRLRCPLGQRTESIKRNKDWGASLGSVRQPLTLTLSRREREQPLGTSCLL
jgi:hypothetical protein